MHKRILFFIQGEGRGHMTQAIAMKKMLEKNNDQVVACFIGTSSKRRIPEFFYTAMDTPVHTFASPNFITDNKNKSIRIFYSIWYNIMRLKKYTAYFDVFDRKIAEYKPDVIINFYEPLIGLYNIFRKPAVPMVSVGHQYLFLHHRFLFPSASKWTDRFAVKWFTKLTSARSVKRLALSFYPLTNSEKFNVGVVPPLLRNEVFKFRPVNQEFILIYILNHGYSEEIIKWHKKNPNIKLHCFWDKPQLDDVFEFDKTLYFHRLDDKKFLDYMSRCTALVTTAGFESVCEAMYLQKPVMMVPVHGHFEQFCNSRDAHKAGAGVFADTFDLDVLMAHLPLHGIDYTDYTTWVQSSTNMIIAEIEQAMGYDEYHKKIKPAISDYFAEATI